jgi:hypothetical protein
MYAYFNTVVTIAQNYSYLFQYMLLLHRFFTLLIYAFTHDILQATTRVTLFNSGFNNDPTSFFPLLVASTMTLQNFFPLQSFFPLQYLSPQVNNDLNSIGHNKCKELFSNDFNLMWTRIQSGQESPMLFPLWRGCFALFFFHGMVVYWL